jgi:tetratricopeptide (TPR) repeat protein
VYWARGEKEDAIEELRSARPPGSGDVTTQLERAKLLFSLGKVAEATEELARLERYRPGNRLIRSYLKAGGILREAKADEALPQYGRTLSGNANTAEAHNNLGVYYTRLGISFREVAFFDLAVDSLEAALRIEPQSFPVQNNLGNVYFELGKLEEAARAYKRVLSVVPDRAETHYNLGLVYEKQGMRAMAAREFETASALKPHWSIPKARLIQMEGRRGPTVGEMGGHDGTGRNQ